MSDEELFERLTHVPYEEFVRAHSLLADSPDDVPGVLRQLADHFRANPTDDFVMGPNFLAVLALFSQRGREIAASAMSASDIRRRQQELAATTPAIAAAFPDIGDGDEFRME